MKVLIVSDTHGRNENYFKVLEMEQPDMVIHCGDVEGGEYALTAAAQCPVMMVSGNNDFFSSLPREAEFNIGSYSVWVTHGHNYHVSMGPEWITTEAVARRKDIVFYGHTHRPVVKQKDGVYSANPGSLSYPRQEGKQPSYLIMEIGENEELNFTIKYL